MITVPKLILEDAKIIVDGAEKKAKEIGVEWTSQLWMMVGIY